jgi:hypothetical protein
MAEKTEAEKLEALQLAELQRSSRKGKKSVRFAYFDEEEIKKSEETGLAVLEKSVVTTIQDLQRGKTITRLAFDEDPTTFNKYQSLYKPKTPNQIPDFVLKRISHRDDLVSACSLARANQISAHGRPLENRFSVGFRLEPNKGVMERLDLNQKEQLKKGIEEATTKLVNCGSNEGVDHDDRLSLSGYLYQQARNAVIFGRFATEISFITGLDGKQQFHSFRPVDAGTIFYAAPKPDGLSNVRQQALRLLQELKNEKLRPEKFEDDEYAFVEVINGYPRQAFTADEMYVHNVFPVTDIEMGGYPVTPIDNAIDAILTHMNITSHNKLYFQSGRAARGMIVIKSADINQDIVAQIRQHFNASINSVQNSWRVPVFGIDPDEEVSWEPLEVAGGGRDMEFQFLSDSNARVILSAFQMSPEELPGYAHLSKGTNNQALSESNNEYKLEAARDVGIRPLLVQFQDFLNERVLPLLSPVIAKLCTLKFYGLDQDSPEKENARIQTEMASHCTYDEVRARVEKEPIGKNWGGNLPLNAGVLANWDKYFTVGEILEHWCGRENASKDANLNYRRDPFYFNFLQLQMQIQQMQQQQQQMDQQQQMETSRQAAMQAEGGEGKDQQQEGEVQNEVTSGADQALHALGKSEAQLPPNKRRLLAQHRMTVKSIMDQWEKESEQALEEVLNVAKTSKPKR